MQGVNEGISVNEMFYACESRDQSSQGRTRVWGVSPPVFVKYVQKVGSETFMGRKRSVRIISERYYHFVSK